jgi:hypothetical protein
MLPSTGGTRDEYALGRLSVMRWVRSSQVLALAAALALAPSSRVEAQHFGQNRVQYRRFDMRVMKTPRFDVYYPADEEQAARMAACMAERWYARLSLLLDARPPAHQPLILYASQPDSQQTNVLGGQEPREGTRGTMEPLTRRVILHLAGSLGETDHLLGHQLVHAFQFAETSFKSNGAMRALALERMPLWFVEGMAEYLSIGSVDAHTAIWMRDAVAEKRLPRIKDLDKNTQFPDRWGQALWAYIAGRWGDPEDRGALQRLARVPAGCLCACARARRRDGSEAIAGLPRPRAPEPGTGDQPRRLWRGP